MDSLVVYDSKKLPPEIQQLQDADHPLPAGTQFFEERFTYADLAKQFIWGVVLVPVGVVVLIVATFILFHLDQHSANYDAMSKFFGVTDIGAVLIIGCGYLFLKSLPSKYQVIRRQNRGVASRYGIFLMDDQLVYNEDDATKVVPTTSFKGLTGRQVRFEHNGEIRSFTLPTKLVGRDVQSLDAAVADWANGIVVSETQRSKVAEIKEPASS